MLALLKQWQGDSDFDSLNSENNIFFLLCVCTIVCVYIDFADNFKPSELPAFPEFPHPQKGVKITLWRQLKHEGYCEFAFIYTF